jgi:hypothetical protein
MLQESEDNEAEEEFPSFAPASTGTVIHKEKIPTPTPTPPPSSPTLDTSKASNAPSDIGLANSVKRDLCLLIFFFLIGIDSLAD